MSRKSKWEYFKAIYQRYHKASKTLKHQILDEFCFTCGYHRKYAIRLLNAPLTEKPSEQPRARVTTYGPELIRILSTLWEAAGYPWSVRLKALLPLWLPWAKKLFTLTASLQQQLLCISPSTMDRRLKSKKQQLKRKIYGRTKPGTLLKHHIPIKTDHWDTTTPGFTEVDLVSHSGNSADGEFIHSLNMTDIHTTWVETRAVMGKGQAGMLNAINEIQHALPFELRGLDSDNGSEFIHYHLKAFCDHEHIQFNRSRPYKKNDNAHVEQKNSTHVRKLFGYVRYDSRKALDAINELYRNELRLLQNLFLLSVTLVHKERVGSKLKRIYDYPQTPLERLGACSQADPHQVAELKKLRESVNPFELSKTIDQKLERIYQMANPLRSPTESSTPRTSSLTNPSQPLSRTEKDTMKTLSEVFGIPVHVKSTKPHRNT